MLVALRCSLYTSEKNPTGHVIDYLNIMKMFFEKYATKSVYFTTM